MKKTLLTLALLAALAALPGCGGETAAPSGTEPALHSYPETLLEFEAKERGLERIDLSGAAELRVIVNHCEYGEPTQYFTDAATVSLAAEAMSAISVTGGGDGISSTGDYYGLSLYDSQGNYLAGFAIQDGMLMESDGRHSVEGLSALDALEGVRLLGG